MAGPTKWLLALLAVALLGSGVAIADPPLITGEQVQDESLTGADILNDSLTGTDIQESSLSLPTPYTLQWSVVGESSTLYFDAGNDYTASLEAYCPAGKRAVGVGLPYGYDGVGDLAITQSVPVSNAGLHGWRVSWRNPTGGGGIYRQILVTCVKES